MRYIHLVLASALVVPNAICSSRSEPMRWRSSCRAGHTRFSLPRTPLVHDPFRHDRGVERSNERGSQPRHCGDDSPDCISSDAASPEEAPHASLRARFRLLVVGHSHWTKRQRRSQLAFGPAVGGDPKRPTCSELARCMHDRSPHEKWLAEDAHSSAIVVPAFSCRWRRPTQLACRLEACPTGERRS